MPVQILSLPPFPVFPSLSATALGWTKVDIDRVAGASVVVSGGTEATALRVTLPTDCTGNLNIKSLPQFAVGAVVSVSPGTSVLITSLPDLGLNSSVKITSLPDLGANSTVKITSLPAIGFGGSTSITSLPDLGANSSVKITSLPPFPNSVMQVSGTTIAIVGLVSITNHGITSLPDLGANSVVKITSLPDLGANSVVKITSLPDLGANSSVKITSLPPFPNSVMQVSGTTIAITSLPPIPPHAVTNAGTFAVQVTSLPAFAVGSSVTITSLPDLGAGSSVKITSSGILPVNVVAGGAGNGSILDGSDTSIKASVVSYANANVLAVRLTDTSGNYTAAGGGTQYADGVTSGTATGTIAMGLDGTAIHALACNTSGHLQVIIMSMPASSVSISSVTVSNLATVPLTVSGTTIAITSLPDLGANSVVKITSLPDLGANSSIKITSLPPFPAGIGIVSIASNTNILTVSGTTIAITSLPPIPTHGVTATGIVSIASNTSILTISGTTIAIVGIVSVTNHGITSLPALGFGGLVSISNVAFTVSNLATALVSNTVTSVGTFRITSLPDLGLNSSIKVTSLPPFAVGSAVVISENAYRTVIGTTPPLAGYFRMTATYPSAQTNAMIVQRPASTTSLHIMGLIFSNAQTHGNFSLIESGISSKIIMERIYFQNYGGAVMSFGMPLVLTTNCCLLLTTRSCTDHSITAWGYVL